MFAQADLVLKSGEAFMDLGLLDLSEDAVKKAIALGTKRSSAYRTLAVIERRRGCYAKALEYGRKAIEIRPSFVGNYICVANVYKESQRYEDALEVVIHGLNSCPVDTWRLQEVKNELRHFLKQKR
jgi:tetratricopeptide (TPR) repeat protein